MIMSEPDAKNRKYFLIKFIEISQELFNIQNFHGLTSIIAGLQAYSINRLKKTWASVPNEYIEKFNNLRFFFFF
jgi:hypothetical protein